MLRQHKFLSALLEKLGSAEGTASVIADVEKLRKFITDPDRVAVHIAANLDKMPAVLDCEGAVEALENIVPKDLPPGHNK